MSRLILKVAIWIPCFGVCLPTFAADPSCFLRTKDGRVVDLSFLCGNENKSGLLQERLEVPFKPPETFGASPGFTQDFEKFVAGHPEEGKKLNLKEVVENSRKICELYEEGTIGEYRKKFVKSNQALANTNTENTKQETDAQPVQYTIGYEAAKVLGTKHLCPEFNED